MGDVGPVDGLVQHLAKLFVRRLLPVNRGKGADDEEGSLGAADEVQLEFEDIFEDGPLKKVVVLLFPIDLARGRDLG